MSGDESNKKRKEAPGVDADEKDTAPAAESAAKDTAPVVEEDDTKPIFDRIPKFEKADFDAVKKLIDAEEKEKKKIATAVALELARKASDNVKINPMQRKLTVFADSDNPWDVETILWKKGWCVSVKGAGLGTVSATFDFTKPPFS